MDLHHTDPRMECATEPRSRRAIRRAGRAALALGLATGGVLAVLVPASGADEYQADTTATTLTQHATASVNITLVATDDAGWSGDDREQNRCNLRGEGQFAAATVTSDDPAVATVSPASLTFTDCGQALPIAITGATCGSTVVRVTHASDTSAGGVNATFSDEEILVTITGCGGGGGVVTCTKPAAPAWANALLKANGTKPKVITNAVSAVAAEMLPGASFPDWRAGSDPTVDVVHKVDQGAYADAVFAYLTAPKSAGGLGLSLPKGPADAARPGWGCTTTTT